MLKGKVIGWTDGTDHLILIYLYFISNYLFRPVKRIILNNNLQVLNHFEHFEQFIIFKRIQIFE